MILNLPARISGRAVALRWYRLIGVLLAAAWVLPTIAFHVVVAALLGVASPFYSGLEWVFLIYRIVFYWFVVFAVAWGCWYSWGIPWFASNDPLAVGKLSPKAQLTEHRWRIRIPALMGVVYGCLFIAGGLFLWATSVRAHDPPVLIGGAGLLGVSLVGVLLTDRLAKRVAERYETMLASHAICPDCGYDLRGNPSAATCPECGGAVTT